MQRSLLAAVILSGSVALAACTSANHLAGQNTSVPTTAPATTVPVAPPTSVWSATAPQASPDAAAARLISAWSTGDSATAGTVASPAAVATLFAQPYPRGYLQARGCTTGANPGTCTYRNTKTDGIYEIQVASGSAGWYVTAVVPET